MTMQVPEQMNEAIEALDGELQQRVEISAVGAITKSEVEAQMDCAHRYPRSVGKFLREATTLATMTEEIAQSCLYSVPRDGKQITGPSVRLAEIVASAYGNLHFGARIVEEGERDITAQGICWDIQKNVRVTVETKRRITTRQGKRYGDDMIILTGNAAASIALRNAIFRVIPRSYVMMVYDQARQVAVGDAKTLDTKRAAVLGRFAALGVTRDRVLGQLGKASVEDIGLEDLEALIGMGTAIKNGERRIEEVFPVAAPAPVAATEDGKRISLRGTKPVEKPPEREPGADG